MGWLWFTLAMGAFFLSHSLPMRPRIKAALVRRLGARGFTAAYGTLSLFMLGWLIVAAGQAPYQPIWGWAPWQMWVPEIAMAVVCVIVALSLGRPNPFSFGGANNDRFEPSHPGLVRWMRHPLLVAIGLWAAAHMIPNGDLAHVILFGVFAGFAPLGMRIIDRRKRRLMGDEWGALQASVRAGPLLTMPAHLVPLMLRLAGAGLLYGVLVWGHPLIIGVAPF